MGVWRGDFKAWVEAGIREVRAQAERGFVRWCFLLNKRGEPIEPQIASYMMNYIGIEDIKEIKVIAHLCPEN